MNNKMIVLLTLLMSSLSLFANTSASSVKFKIYQIAVSEDADECTNPKVIFQSSKGVVKDLMSNPVLGSGFLADGSYPCIMITMDDILNFIPKDEIPGVCTKGQTYTGDLCMNETQVDVLVGTTFTKFDCTTSPDKVTLYLKTISDNGNTYSTFKKDGLNGIKLKNPFVVKGAKTGTFYVDTTDGVMKASDNSCSLEKAVFGFR